MMTGRKAGVCPHANRHGARHRQHDGAHSGQSWV